MLSPQLTLTWESLRGRSSSVGGVGMVAHAADHRDITALRILEAEAVVALRLAQFSRRIDGFQAISENLRVQRVDGCVVGGIEHHANQRRLRQSADCEDVVEGASPAQIMHTRALASGCEVPHLGKEMQCFVGIGKSEIDAAQRSDLCLAHAALPKKRAALS